MATPAAFAIAAAGEDLYVDHRLALARRSLP
jgi:hypothetical protein